MRILHWLVLSIGLFAALAASAQSEAETGTDDETWEGLSDLALGEPAGPQIGEVYLREIYGDWALRCIKAEDPGAEPCDLYQLLRNEAGVSVAEINVFPVPPGGQVAAGAVIVVPLETLLTAGLTLAVDGVNARQYPFFICNQAGCIARIGLTAEEVTALKRGVAASLRIVPAAAADQEVVLRVSLTGFTAGFDNTPLRP